MSDRRIIELFPSFDEFITHEETEVIENPTKEPENNANDEDNKSEVV
jgi:hypothetical protein